MGSYASMMLDMTAKSRLGMSPPNAHVSPAQRDGEVSKAIQREQMKPSLGALAVAITAQNNHKDAQDRARQVGAAPTPKPGGPGGKKTEEQENAERIKAHQEKLKKWGQVAAKFTPVAMQNAILDAMVKRGWVTKEAADSYKQSRDGGRKMEEQLGKKSSKGEKSQGDKEFAAGQKELQSSSKELTASTGKLKKETDALNKSTDKHQQIKQAESAAAAKASKPSSASQGATKSAGQGAAAARGGAAAAVPKPAPGM